MIYHTILLISKMDQIKYILEKPTLTGRISCWQMLLSQYDIQYVNQKAIKGIVLSEYLADQLVEDYQPMRFNFQDKDVMTLNDNKVIVEDEGPEPRSQWKLAFDGVSNSLGNGVGVVLIFPSGDYTAFTTRLCFNCTNNIAEHKACILGIKATIYFRTNILEVNGNSPLAIYQVKGEWETRHPKWIPYHAYVI